MISRLSKSHCTVRGVFLFVWLISQAMLTSATDLQSGSVSGTVTLIKGNRTLPVPKARIELTEISDDRDKYQAVADKNGTYSIDLPQGSYRMHLDWMGGDCSIIRRAPFGLKAGEHLILDFLVLECPISDRAIGNLAFERSEPMSDTQSENLMNVPFAKQTEEYQEQLIPARRNRWAEIIVSYGKYDNQVNKTRYFSLHQRFINQTNIRTQPILLSLPVTVTADRYTLQGFEVVLDKIKMVFEAKGGVSVSDGRQKHTGKSATLSFNAGVPTVEINH